MIKLYIDEDVPEAIAIALRLRGYDVITVKDVGRKGLIDIEQLKYASSEKRIIFTHNIADFCKIHSDFIKEGLEHIRPRPFNGNEPDSIGTFLSHTEITESGIDTKA